MKSKSCDNGHQTIMFEGRHSCPMCDLLIDFQLHTSESVRQFTTLTNEMQDVIEDYEAFKAKCVCGKLAADG